MVDVLAGDEADGIADTLLSALGGVGADYDDVISAFRRVQSTEQWVSVLKHFKDRCGQGIMTVMKQELGDRDTRRALDFLAGRGVDFDGASAPEVLVAKRLYRAMEGIGGDDAAVLRTIEAGVTSSAMWEKIVLAFRELYSYYHNGDLRKALRTELSEPSVDRCRTLLGRKGVALTDATRDAAARISGIAQAIFKALTGMTTDEEGVEDALSDVNDTKDWKHLRKYYRQRYGSDLIAALRLELHDGALSRCADALAPAGVVLDTDGPSIARRGGAGFGDTVFDEGFDALPEARLGTQELLGADAVHGGGDNPALLPGGKWKCSACGTIETGRPAHADGARRWCGECWDDWDAGKALDGMIVYSEVAAQAALIAAMECGDDASSSEGERDRLPAIAFKDFPLMIEGVSGPQCRYSTFGQEQSEDTRWGTLRELLDAPGSGISLCAEFICPHLSDTDLVSLMRCCTALRRAVDTEPMWRRRCLMRFGDVLDDLPPPAPPPPGGVAQRRDGGARCVDQSAGWRGRYAAVVERSWGRVEAPLVLSDNGFTVASLRTEVEAPLQHRSVVGRVTRGPRRWVFHFRDQQARGPVPQVGVMYASQRVGGSGVVELSVDGVWGIVCVPTEAGVNRLVACHAGQYVDIVPQGTPWSVCSSAELELRPGASVLQARVTVGELLPGRRGPTLWRRYETELPYASEKNGSDHTALRPFATLLRGQSVTLPVFCWKMELGLEDADGRVVHSWRCASCGHEMQGAVAHADGGSGRRWCGDCWADDDWDGDKAWGVSPSGDDDDNNEAQGARDGGAGAFSWIQRLVDAASAEPDVAPIGSVMLTSDQGGASRRPLGGQPY
eukprot:TRINITY_DN10710_c0_g1_i1.p1 TRINITY_DN10710_c0_g1~~TRINITY_DN10710_c0_g1_i1.p1  ORF type:complete len:844 (+),score=40.37 TRINITY_DN10710_c0_g1_i1:119-2650(+)